MLIYAKLERFLIVTLLIFILKLKTDHTKVYDECVMAKNIRF